MVKNGSEILIDALVEQGVDTIFGYPGGAVLNIYDALYKNSDRIHHILTAHEQGAAHAADGYAVPPARSACASLRAAGRDQPRHRHRNGLYGLHPDGRHHRQRRHEPHRPRLLPGGLYRRHHHADHQAQFRGTSRRGARGYRPRGVPHCAVRTSGSGAPQTSRRMSLPATTRVHPEEQGRGA